MSFFTRFHPQTNGQSEKAFRKVEETLTCAVKNSRKDWNNFLTELEFAYNNQPNAATKHTPFFSEYGEHPFSLAHLLMSDSPIISNNAVGKFVEDIKRNKLLAKASV